VGRITFFLNESVPADLISDTWNKVVNFYLGSDRVVTTTNVRNIINVSVMWDLMAGFSKMKHIWLGN
jgi:hypothetical protein